MSETEQIPPKYSIIIINANSLMQTMKCVESILAHTQDFELIVIDNASNDGSISYLESIASDNPVVLKIIESKNRNNFSVNNNIALKAVHPQSQYIIFLNNDTIVTPHWLDRMEQHLLNVPLPNIGAVGPVCNNSNGKQCVPFQNNSEVWHDQHHGQWAMTGILYGWCMMFKREVIDKIGGFDERFINGHEDNDLCLRAQLAGYQLIIAIDVYIYHEGQASLRKVLKSKDEYLEQGMINRENYHNKWYDHEKARKKLVAVYRTNNGPHFEESLEQASKFSDSIIIHFCRAGNDFYTYEPPIYIPRLSNREGYELYLKNKFPKITDIGWYDGIFQEDYERNWLLQKALEYQRANEADWCISIDDDEIYEDKFIDRVQAMMNPRNPEVFAYAMNWRTIWKTELGVEYFRADDTFGQFINHRFFRLIQGQVIKSMSHPEGHHCGSSPFIASENIKWTNIRVRHLGYDTPEQRQKKFDFYQKNDNFKRREDIGHEDYHHLIDQNVNYQVYDPDHSISFVTMIKNEEAMILSFLESVQDLVDEYVIVDTGSTDKTLEIINEFSKYCPVPVRVLNYPWEKNYSTPRNFGRMHAKGKWILRMDADERFMMADISKLFNLTERDMDFLVFHVINYLEDQQPGMVPKYASTESMRLYRNMPDVYYTGLVHESMDDCFSFINRARQVKCQRAPIYLHHYGYLKDKPKVRAKLDMYEYLNNRQIEITNSTDPRPFFNMALHYLNDDRMSDALKMFNKCIEIDNRFWLAHQQLAALNMKSAKVFLGNCINTIPPSHPFRNEAAEILEFLNKRSVGHVKVT